MQEGDKTEEGNQQEEQSKDGGNQQEAQGGSLVRRSRDGVGIVEEGGNPVGEGSYKGGNVGTSKEGNGGIDPVQNSIMVQNGINNEGGDGNNQVGVGDNKKGGMGDGAGKKEVGTKGVQTTVTECNPQRTLLRYRLQKVLGEV